MNKVQLNLFDIISDVSNPQALGMTAATMFQDYFLYGSYIPMKQNENHLKAIKSEMKGRLKDNENNRIEFNNVDMVAKWRRVPKYKVDFEGLNEMLYDYGLIQTIQIPTKGLAADVKEALEPFALPPKQIVVPNTNNKVAKELMTPKKELRFKRVEDSRILGLYGQMYNTNKVFEYEYSSLKKKMLNCQVLQEKKKLTFDYGSVSIRENPTGYNLNEVINQLGIDFLIQNGKPNMEEVETFILKGNIKMSDVNQFRKIEDYRLDFILMTKEAEQLQFKAMQNVQDRRHAISRIRIS